jgi:hypothetical protein
MGGWVRDGGLARDETTRLGQVIQVLHSYVMFISLYVSFLSLLWQSPTT